MITYSFGNTPKDVLKTAIGNKNYSMELVGNDAEIMRRLVNMGIDSHLEAITGKCDWSTRDLKGKPFCRILKCSIDPKGMLCLLRRLLEDGTEEAETLRSDILTTLDIEEV